MSKSIVLERVVLSYPHLFEPSAYKAGDTPRYSATFIITDPQFDWSKVQAALDAAAAERFPNGMPANATRSPIIQVDKGPFAGHYAVKGSSKMEYPPEIVDQNVQKLLDRSALFAGCIVNASLTAFAYEGGLSFGINHVQLVDNQNVTRLDGGKSAEEVFAPIAGAPAPLSGPAGAPAQIAPAQAAPAPAGVPAQAGVPAPAPAQTAPAGVPAGVPSNAPMPWEQ